MEQKTVFPRTHISLFVSDIGETVEFYDKFFNESAAKVKNDYAKYELDAPALTISFIQNPEKVNTSGHYGIQVKTKEELNEKLNLARGHKLVQLEEAETACCYAIQDKFWVNDPDGYEWEIYHFIEDDEKFSSREEVEGEPCCQKADKVGAACC